MHICKCMYVIIIICIYDYAYLCVCKSSIEREEMPELPSLEEVWLKMWERYERSNGSPPVDSKDEDEFPFTLVKWNKTHYSLLDK